MTLQKDNFHYLYETYSKWFNSLYKGVITAHRQFHHVCNTAQHMQDAASFQVL